MKSDTNTNRTIHMQYEKARVETHTHTHTHAQIHINCLVSESSACEQCDRLLTDRVVQIKH